MVWSYDIGSLEAIGGSARMVKKLDCQPGDGAPASATYMLCDDLGNPTGLKPTSRRGSRSHMHRGALFGHGRSAEQTKRLTPRTLTLTVQIIARKQVEAPQFSFSLNIRPYRHHTTTDSYASPCRGWRHYATGESRGLNKKTVLCAVPSVLSERSIRASMRWRPGREDIIR
jgi:hypothetical protein